MSRSSMLSRFLTTSRNVANALDWKKTSGSVLNLSVMRDSIDLAVASHPSFDEPVQNIPSIPLEFEKQNNRKVLSSKVVDELSAIVSQYKICGLVVTWPVQKEGWCGAQCGRVLNVMDQLSNHSDIMNGATPVCLWDCEHNQTNEDEWGRDPIYGVPTHNKTVHIASIDQYKDRNDCVASDIWNDFVTTHWPELSRRKHNNTMMMYEEDMDDRFDMNGILSSATTAPTCDTLLTMQPKRKQSAME